MSDGMIYANDPCFAEHLTRYLGETVTIFTTSGGESGSGFTGVLTLVSPQYVRLVTAIGTPPECSLGNECDFGYNEGCDGGCGGNYGGYGRRNRGYFGGYRRGFGGRRFSGLGSVVDIPINRIAGFVHNTL